VVLREIRDEAEAEAAAKRQGHALRAPIAVGERSVQISASIGVVMAHKQDTPASLLRAADDGMYQAKSTGPGAYRLVNARDTATPGRP
jgi:predicted signal transduction protein with EAL and GGDEF domain